jgi:undecaprenyl-diphosphatase
METLIIGGGYSVLFIFTVLEGIPIVGMAVPGHIAIILAGFFASVGTLNICSVIAIAILGAILGDAVGFLLGRRYGMNFVEKVRPYFFVTDKHIEKARSMLDRHTGKAMVIGRFTPATRALMPFLVGASHTPAAKFWIWNIVGGVSWAVVSVMIGYLFGASYPVVAAYFGKFVVIALAAGIIIIWGYRFVNMHYHIFRRYELLTLILNVIALWVLAKTIQDAWAVQSFMASFDVWVNHSVDYWNQMNLGPIRLGLIATVITNAGSTLVTGGSGIIIGLWLLFRKKWRSAAIMLLSIGSTGIFIGLLKQFFMRARPENALQVILNDPSFPSGHAALAAAFFVIVAYLLAPKIRSWIKREIMIVFCVLAVIAVGLSRILLNVHWTSDVLAGWALGTFCATSSILLVRYLSMLFVKKTTQS